MRIAIVGAYGYTGRLICKELTNAGFHFSIYGRNKEKLNALKDEFNSISTALDLDIRKTEDVEQIMDLSDLIVNCAGPFTEEAQLLVNMAAEKGKIYLDISGEIGFIRDSWIRNQIIALKSNALLVHGCAFESLVADLMIQSLIGTKTGIQSIRSFYWFNQKKISPGTRITMKLSKFRKLFKISNNEWQQGDSIKDQLTVSWSDSDTKLVAVPYPLPEIAYAYWNYRPKTAESFLLLNKDEAMFVGIGNNNDEPVVNVLDKLRLTKQKGPTQEELDVQRSILAIEIIDEKGIPLKVVANAINMYQTTAIAILLTIQKIQNNPSLFTGVLSPAQLFEGSETETLNALKVIIDIDKNLNITDV